MSYYPMESLLRTTMDSLKAMIDVNTVVGDPVKAADGAVIIPVSRVSFGFVTGGGDEAVMQPQDHSSSAPTSGDATMPFTGGTGAGVSVRPVGFLVVVDKRVRFMPVDSKAFYDRLIEEVPGVLDRIVGAFEQRGRKTDSDVGNPASGLEGAGRANQSVFTGPPPPV